MSDEPDSLPPDRMERFTWNFAEVMLSQCAYCSRLSPTSKDAICQAFAGGIIPENILMNQHDHRTPWLDPTTGQAGDTGVHGDESLLFTPKPSVPRAVLDRLYHVLDKVPHA